ncbi:MAG: GspE/PulE family protein [bacterium]|nr:GspE/PulE family protein [bacterium]
MIDIATKKIAGEISISSPIQEEVGKSLHSMEDFRTIFHKQEQGDVTQSLSLLLASALHLDVSDVHLEPEETGIAIRFRVDGILQEATRIDLEQFQTLLSRIKLLSGLKLNVEGRPQDGRFTLLSPDPIEIRVASLPSEHGESIVLRVLNPKRLVLLSDLGLREDLEKLFRKEIQRTHGMILVTGPTGSGKTTTLYSFLKEVQKAEVKVITIEDPIEYHLEGVSQTQTDEAKGYTFASGLRAIVRQDPDIVLVGEMRDKETAEIALQAALTGHLVFSTLHANDAPSTISRLLSLEANPVNIASALRIAIAQRLVRKVCKDCSVMETPTEKELGIIQEGLKNIALNPLPIINEKTLVPRAVGCPSCHNTGYRGRVGIFEAMRGGEELESVIEKSSSPVAIRAFAIKQGMIPLYQDGLLKILNGVTTLEEVRRVAQEE